MLLLAQICFHRRCSCMLDDDMVDGGMLDEKTILMKTWLSLFLREVTLSLNQLMCSDHSPHCVCGA